MSVSDRLSILLVEDDDELRELLVEVLKENEYYVEGASSGPEAVEKARETPFDLVITDIRMGEMNGLDTLLEVREETPDFESMVITGYADEDIPAQALRLGVGEYLKKPFELKDFVKAVERLLQDYKRRLNQDRDRRDTLKAAIWGAEGRALEASRAPAVSAGKLAWELAGELGYSYDHAEQLQLATVLNALERGGSEPPSSTTARILFEDLPLCREVHQACLDLLEKNLLLEEHPYLADLPSDLDYSSEVIRALKQLSQFGAYSIGREPSNTRKWKGLLSVAEALLQRKDHRGAAQAFASVAKEGTPKAASEALLGLARAHGIAGKKEASVKWALEALKTGRGLGPSVECHLALEVGTVLFLQKQEKAIQCFKRAQELASGNGLFEMLPFTKVALALVGGEKLEPTVIEHSPELLAFANLPQLKANLRWFLPLVLECADVHKIEALSSLSSSLVQQFPEELRQLSRSGEVSTSAVESSLASRTQPAKLPAEPVAKAHDNVLRCYSLGAFEVYMGDQRLEHGEWKSQKTRYLLAFLAAHKGKPVSEERILEDFWEGRSKSNLYAACSHLRKQLRPKGSKANYIVREAGMIRLNYDLGVWHDLDELDLLESNFRTTIDSQKLLQMYRQAVSLYRGPYLDGCTMEWADPVRVRINRTVVTALGRLVETALQAGNYAQVEESANALLRIDSCNQDATLALVKALVGEGRPEQAARQFQLYSKTLERELGLEPSIEAVKAFNSIMMAV